MSESLTTKKVVTRRPHVKENITKTKSRKLHKGDEFPKLNNDQLSCLLAFNFVQRRHASEIYLLDFAGYAHFNDKSDYFIVFLSAFRGESAVISPKIFSVET